MKKKLTWAWSELSFDKVSTNVGEDVCAAVFV